MKRKASRAGRTVRERQAKWILAHGHLLRDPSKDQRTETPPPTKSDGYLAFDEAPASLSDGGNVIDAAAN